MCLFDPNMSMICLLALYDLPEKVILRNPSQSTVITTHSVHLLLVKACPIQMPCVCDRLTVCISTISIEKLEMVIIIIMFRKHCKMD